MAIQRIGGSRVYVITGSNRDSRLTSSGQSWANLVTSQKYKMYAEAQKATLMDIKDTERRYQEELKVNAQIRKDINAEIKEKQKLKDRYVLEGAKSAQKIREKKALVDAGIGVGGSSGYNVKTKSDIELQERYKKTASTNKARAEASYRADEKYNKDVDKAIGKLSDSPSAALRNKARIDELELSKKEVGPTSRAYTDKERAAEDYRTLVEYTPEERKAWAKSVRESTTRVQSTGGKDFPAYVAPSAIDLSEPTAEIDAFIAAKQKQLAALGRPTLPPPVDLIGRTRGTYDDKFGTAKTQSTYAPRARQAELEALGVSEQEFEQFVDTPEGQPLALNTVTPNDGTQIAYEAPLTFDADRGASNKELQRAIWNEQATPEDAPVLENQQAINDAYLNTESDILDDMLGVEPSRKYFTLDDGTQIGVPPVEKKSFLGARPEITPEYIQPPLPQQSMYPPTQQMRGPNLTPMRNRDLEMEALGFKPAAEMGRVDPMERDDVTIPATATEGAYHLRAIRDPSSNAVVKYVKFYGTEPADDSFVYQVGEARTPFFGDNSATEVERIFKRAKAAQSFSANDLQEIEFPEEEETITLPFEVRYKQTVISDAASYDAKKVNRMTSGVMLPWQKLVVDLYPMDDGASEARQDALLKNAWDQITIQYSGRKSTMEKAHTLLLAIDRIEQQKTTIGED